jgi:hypothetical protein
VDAFRIKYIVHEDADHLVASIKKTYEISSDWTGSAYCGLKFDWYYNNGTVGFALYRVGN